MYVGVAQNDPRTRREVCAALTAEGHVILTARSAQEALTSFSAGSGLDVIVLDTRLPDAAGQDVCLKMRVGGLRTPVIFVVTGSARDERLAAFRAGADDFLTSPFEMAELLARLEALCRRASPRWVPTTGLRLDPASHAVCTATGQTLLTPTEFRILATITARPTEVIRRQAVVAAAWPDRVEVSENLLDSYIRKVRVKLTKVDSPVRIQTVRGVGFRVS